MANTVYEQDANGIYSIPDGAEPWGDLMRHNFAELSKMSGKTYTVTAAYSEGAFNLSGLPDTLPELFGVRFAAPESFSEGDVIRIGNQSLELYSQGMEALEDGAFAEGAVVVIDIDLAGNRAFFKTGGGSGTGSGAAAEYGVLPSQTKITVKAGNARADVTLENAGGNDFAGTRLVVKQGSAMPQDVRDGDVYDVGKAISYALQGFQNEQPYVARAFAYNYRSEVQTDVIGAVESFTPTAAENPPPGNVLNFTAKARNEQIILTWVDPGDSSAAWKGTMIRHKPGSYPADETDGVLVVDSKTRNQYQTTGFVDTGLTNGTAYYYQAFPYSTAGVYNRNAANRVTATPVAGRALSALPLGTVMRVLVRGEYKYAFGSFINFRVVDQNHPGYPAGSTAVITDRIPCLMCYDAKEPANSGNRKTYGNNRHIYSNLLQWLNSEAGAGEWYIPQHSFDQKPDEENVYNKYNEYDRLPGFLSIFPADFVASLMPTTLYVNKASTDGGGTETFERRMFLASLAEVGKTGNEGTRLAYFNDNAGRKALPTQEAVTNSDYKSTTVAVDKGCIWWLRTCGTDDSGCVSYVSTTGSTSSAGRHAYMGHAAGVRPLCNLPNNLQVGLQQNADGSYDLIL